jgi:hypothetical protein
MTRYGSMINPVYARRVREHAGGDVVWVGVTERGVIKLE